MRVIESRLAALEQKAPREGRRHTYLVSGGEDTEAVYAFIRGQGFEFDPDLDFVINVRGFSPSSDGPAEVIHPPAWVGGVPRLPAEAQPVV